MESLQSVKKEYSNRIKIYLVISILSGFLLDYKSVLREVIFLLLTVYLVIVHIIYIKKVRKYVSKKQIMIFNLFMILVFLILFLPEVIGVIKKCFF